MIPRAIRDPKLMKLVEQQMRNWELARNQTDTEKPKTRQAVEDFVCISRDVGSGGNQVGVMLGERLHWPVFDKEILHAMAGEDGVREQIYASMDERDLGWCEEALRPLIQPEFTRNDYFHQLSKTILSLARQGNAIFVGRGADLILPREVGLRVHIIAPLKERIKMYARRCNLSLKDAEVEMRRIEAERSQFIRHYFPVDGHNQQRFDLVINLQRMTTTQAVHLIESARHLLASGERKSEQHSG